jgi:three-Cys-motif partner protein
MSKDIEHRTWNNVPFNTWEYELQTEMKHRVLKYYLPIWAKILSKGFRQLTYIDGFGGIGAYHTQEDIVNGNYISNKFGSPIFSCQAISNLLEINQLHSVNAIIIDRESSNIENIEKICNYLKLNRDIQYTIGDFDAEINKILDELETQNNPTFFLIDPFGFTIRMKTIERIMRLPNTEIVVNFMYNSIQRFLKHPNENVNKLFDELFGTNQWTEYADKTREDKELELVNLFRNQCKIFTKFVYPFKLNFPEKNRPYYYLFHLTNHYLGCKLMKESFANNNEGEFVYTGTKLKDETLFDKMAKHEIASITNLCSKCFIENSIKNSMCENCLLEIFANIKIDYEKFLEEVIDKIPFNEKHIKKMLNDFESKGYLQIESKRYRTTGIENDDLLIFHQWEKDK